MFVGEGKVQILIPDPATLSIHGNTIQLESNENKTIRTLLDLWIEIQLTKLDPTKPGEN